MASGRPLDQAYERDWFQAEVRRAGIDRLGGFVPYPPANALLLLPLAWLPPLPAKAVWTALLAVAMAGSFLVLRRIVDVSPWTLAMVFLVESASLANAFLYGQPYPLLLLLQCLSLAALLRGRPMLCGLALSPVVALKLYALPLLLRFVWTGRWRAASGALLGVVLLTGLSLALLGPGVHAAYVREVLPRSLAGELQDPYATSWGSVQTLAHRLFEAEPDLNPNPVTDAPALAEALSRGVPLALVALSVLAAPASGADPRPEWAALTLASLVVSPIPASFHFVLLVLPVALLLPGLAAPRAAGLLALLAFVTSPLPHHLARFASGWGNLLAHGRLFVLLALFAVLLRPGLRRPASAVRRVAGAGCAGILAAATGPLPLSRSSSAAEEPWTRVAEARGFLLAEPTACEGGLAWETVEGERLVVRGPDGRILRGRGDTLAPRCVSGRLVTRTTDEAGGLAGDEVTADRDRDTSPEGLCVVADRARGELRESAPAGECGPAGERGPARERVLARGIVRHPRLSPDSAWVVFQSWAGGSWDIQAVERATGRLVSVTRDAANEVEPSWVPSGDRIVFASDRRRGLGFTTLYEVAFRR